MPKQRRDPKYKNKLKRQRKQLRRSIPWLWIVGIGVAIVVLAIIIFQGPNLISPNSAYNKYEAGTFFLDVRAQSEFAQVHIPGSTLIPLEELPSRIGELPPDQDIIVVCRTGRRSLTGMNILKQAGFKNVYGLNGGLEAWQAAGLPVETSLP